MSNGKYNVYMDQNRDSVSYTTKDSSLRRSGSDEEDTDQAANKYRESRLDDQRRKKRDSLYLILSSSLDLLDTALILLLLIQVWAFQYYSVLLAGVILSVVFVVSKLSFAILVLKKKHGFWSGPWTGFIMDVVSTFVPGCVIPLFVIAADQGYLPEGADCDKTTLETWTDLVCIIKVAQLGVSAGLPWLCDLITCRGCICVCDLFDCDDCGMERCCQYILGTVCDKLLISVRILCLVLIVIFGIVGDPQIGSICTPAAATNATMTTTSLAS